MSDVKITGINKKGGNFANASCKKPQDLGDEGVL